MKFYLAPDAVVVIGAMALITVTASALFLWERRRFRKLRKAHSDLSGLASALEQSVSQAILTSDAQGLICGSNSAAQELLGYAPEEIQGRSVSELLLLSAAAKRETRERLPGRDGLPVDASHKDGTLMPVWLRAIPIKSDDQPRVLFFIEDLTRHQRQAQLETENQLLWPTFDEAGLVIAVVDSEGRIIRLSGAGANLLDVSDPEVEGRLYWELFQKEEDWDSARSSFEQAKTKLGPSRLKAEWITPNRRSVPLDWLMLSPAWDGAGALAHVVVTASLASPASLAYRRQTLRTIERIVGRIAGHLENLLSTINGYSDLVLRDLSHSSPLRKDMEQILAASERASETTHQLLGFSGHRLIATERLDLNVVLARLDIELLPHQGPVVVLGNRQAFEETFTVLAEYIVSRRPGYKRPVFATELTRLAEARTMIDADELVPGDYVKLNVSMGKVPEQELIVHLLEPFGSPMRGSGHTAVGLAIVNGMARSCGGGLSVACSPDENVTLEIWLPAAGATANDPSVGSVPKSTSARAAMSR